MLSVSEIWRYPIKSVGGEQLTEAMVTGVGIAGDRGWGIYDLDSDTVLTARRSPELLFASARVDDGAVVMELPDGQSVRVGESGNLALSAWLGRNVELRPAGTEGGTYEVPLDFENDENWVSWQGPGDAWHDSPKSRVSLVSRATLANWDARRFRTNVLLDGGGEDELVGSSVRVGSIGLDITKRIDRCVIVTRPQPGLERDLDVLRTINAERETCLAIGARVSQPGTLRPGLEMRPDGEPTAEK